MVKTQKRLWENKLYLTVNFYDSIVSLLLFKTELRDGDCKNAIKNFSAFLDQSKASAITNRYEMIQRFHYKNETCDFSFLRSTELLL